MPLLSLQFSLNLRIISYTIILTFDNDLRGLIRTTSRISQNDTPGANLSLQELARGINYHGKIAIAWDPNSAPLRDRKGVLDAMLKSYPDIEVVDDLQATGETADTILEQTKLLVHNHPDLKAIWAIWNLLAMWVCNALIKEDRTDIAVHSFDLCPSDKDWMLGANSPWKTTVAADAFEVGRIVIRMAVLAAHGIEIERGISIPMKMITREMLEQSVSAGQSVWSESELGWTPWLRSQQVADQRFLMITDIIDFDDQSLQSSINIGRKIASMMGETQFEPYLRMLMDHRKMELAGVSMERLEQETINLNRVFVEYFNKISETQRVAIMFDTTDALTKKLDIYEYIVNLASKLENTVLLIAGRNTKEIYKKVSTSFGLVEFLDLPHLEEQASHLYLQEKQKLLNVQIDDELAEKLLLLAQGRPILIDLAVEWLSRQIPVEWIVDQDIDNIKKLAHSEKKKLQMKFEQQLVRHIVNTRHDLDWLALVLSRVYPLDIELAANLLSISQNEAKQLFRNAQSYVFVKTLPDGRISLHDEMRRMVNEYVWPDVDPDNSKRRRDSSFAAKFLQMRVQELQDKIQTLLNQGQDARDHNDLEVEYQTFVKREKLDYILWIVQEQLLGHTLFANLDEGIDAFSELFDLATQNCQTFLRGTLIAKVEPYREQLSPKQIYQLDTRKVRQLIDQGETDEAEKLTHQILTQESIRPGERLNLFTLLANSFIRRGDFPTANSQMQEALKICQTIPDLRHWEATVLNTLGLVNRKMENIDNASEYYERALRASIEPRQIASTLNNIGYIRALRGDYRSAINYCEQALEIYERLSLRKELGATLTTLGEIHRLWKKYDESFEYYKRAMEIFTPEGDPIWLARLYGYRGKVYRLQNELELAREELENSLDYEMPVEQAWVYHVLGCVYWDKNDLDMALSLFGKSNDLAKKVYDLHSQVNNLVACAEIYYQQWVTSGKSDSNLVNSIQAKSAELENILQGLDIFPLHRGRMLRVLADLSFDQKNYDDALKKYSQAYIKLGEQPELYGRRTLLDELDHLAEQITKLTQQESPGLAIQWCEELRKEWEKDSSLAHRDALVSMCDVQEIEIRISSIMLQDKAND